MSWKNYIKHCRHFGSSMNFTADMQSCLYRDGRRSNPKGFGAIFPGIRDPEALWDAMVDHEIALSRIEEFTDLIKYSRYTQYTNSRVDIFRGWMRH